MHVGPTSSAHNAGERETAAKRERNDAIREVEFGHPTQAQRRSSDGPACEFDTGRTGFGRCCAGACGRHRVKQVAGSGLLFHASQAELIRDFDRHPLLLHSAN